MADFKREETEHFLAVVRKYMQLRGPMSQKELAEMTDVGISTMSRFLSQKTSELNPQLIAKITAKLDIPLHEIIEFVEEDFADRFKRLVTFYKDENAEVVDEESPAEEADDKVKREKTREILRENSKDRSEKSLKEKMETLTPRQKAFMAEFLNLNLEERDLIVDVGNNMFQYFKMKGMDI